MIKKLILASTLLWTLPANALTITNDPGGLIPMYVARMQSAAAMGERVIIDGNCLSACTMTLGIIPPQNVCATPRAVLGFHSAFTLGTEDGLSARNSADGIALSACYSRVD